MKTIEELQALRDKLVRERDEYLRAAERDVAFLNGRIKMLEELLQVESEESPPTT